MIGGSLKDRYKMPVLLPINQSVLMKGSQLRFDYNVQEMEGKFLVNLNSFHHQDLLYRLIPADKHSVQSVLCTI